MRARRASPHWVSDGVAASARLFPLLAGLVGEESLATQSAALFKEAGFAVNLIPSEVGGLLDQTGFLTLPFILLLLVLGRLGTFEN